MILINLESDDVSTWKVISHYLLNFIMLLRYSYIIILLLFSLTSTAQSFEGKIVYYFTFGKIEEEVQEKTEAAFGVDFLRSMDSTYTEYIIKEDKLLLKKINKDGRCKWISQQEKGTAITYLPSGRSMTYSTLKMQSMDNPILKKKTKKFKNILGFKCRRFEYEVIGDGRDVKITAWIAEDFPFNKDKHLTKNFNRIFLPHGLAFERREIINGSEKVFKIIKIEHYKVENEEFDFSFPSDN